MIGHLATPSQTFLFQRDRTFDRLITFIRIRTSYSDSTVGKGKITDVETSSCIRVASDKERPLANTEVTVNRVVCIFEPCKYYCHGSDKELSLQLKSSEYTQHTASARGLYPFPKNTTVAYLEAQ